MVQRSYDRATAESGAPPQNPAPALPAPTSQRPRHRMVASTPLSSPARSGGITAGFVGAVGNTPLIRLNALSDLTGCDILGKAEFMNPGGSVKD
jgi:hypothetical protein